MTHEEDLKMLNEAIEKRKLCNQDPQFLVKRFKEDLKLYFEKFRYGLFADENIDAKHGLKTIVYDIFLETLNEYLEE